MSLKSFIFSQADKPVVKEKKEIDHTYKKFRIEIITSVFISYAVFYLTGNDSNLLIVFYVQIMPDDFVMQLHR
ncbi:hypothetical protein VC921_22115, partial [Citrobacter freundii]|nr:hypothetical protein [Citrobacter freundii]